MVMSADLNDRLEMVFADLNDRIEMVFNGIRRSLSQFRCSVLILWFRVRVRVTPSARISFDQRSPVKLVQSPM